MPGLYERLLSAGGYTGPATLNTSNPWVWQQAAAQSDPSLYGWKKQAVTAENLRSNRGLLEEAGLWNSAWDEFSGGWNAGDQEMQGGSAAYKAPDLSSLAGYSLGSARSQGHQQLLGVFNPQGELLAGSAGDAPGSSMRSREYILAAAALGGGYLAGGGFGALGGSGGAVEGAVATGAQSFPVAAQAPIQFSPLGQAAAVGGGGAGAVSAAGGAASNPLAAYLTTGASEMSTMGSMLTGAGGASGAVGQGTAASYLQQLGGAASNFLGNGGARSAVDIISGLYGLKLAGDAREASDPFGQYRGAYGAQLAALEANPSSLVGRPGYQAGMEAIQRNNAARGYAGSGNEMAIMSRYGGEFFNAEVNRLAGLAGANVAPGAGQFPAAQLAGQGLASIGYGLAPFLGGGPK